MWPVMLHGHQIRRDLPRTIRGLYPNARTRARLRVVSPDREVLRVWERLLVLWQPSRILVAASLGAGALAGSLLGGGEWTMRLAGAGLATCTGAVASRIFGRLLRSGRWRAWARQRGAILDELPQVELPRGWTFGRHAAAWHVTLGDRRRINVHLVAAPDVGRNGRRLYAVVLQLPPGAGEVFPASSFQRRHRETRVDELLASGTLLELESERLVREGELLVRGGDAVDWRQLFDPALVDLLASGIDVEWVQEGEVLVLTLPVRERALSTPDAARLDTLAVAAVAFERRIASILGDGRAVEPAVVPRPGSSTRAAREQRYLTRERARDLALDPEALFLELSRYTTATEVAQVRARVDAGEFPLEYLDDLVHHRRAAFWGTGTADAA
ncbi:MAG: hypothetical protein JWM98_190 [Thermoleophilia bacterium]|nr:hypothetical protein [Thermoleophilia bacterium]